MKKSFLIFFTCLLLQFNTFAQKEFINKTLDQNFFYEQTIDIANINMDSLMLDSMIIEYKNSNLIPGLTSMIIKDNQLIWNKNYGFRNLQNQLPVEDSTFFLIASVSKLIIATAVMQLWENGMINLESDINNYLPVGFSVINPNYPNDSITVKMLMTHTSSIQDNWNMLVPLTTCGDSPIALDTFLINYLTPGGAYYSIGNFFNQPGQQYNYTNVGASLLALIVSSLTGKGFDEYCRDSIFIPLSMYKTSWFLAGMNLNEIATPYVGTTPVCHEGWPCYPSGFLRTNKMELLNFLYTYMNGGVYNNYTLLDSGTINYMLTDHLGYIINGIRVQGLIWNKRLPFYPSLWGHFGSWKGVETFMGYNPSEDYGLIWFQNSGDPNSYYMSHEIFPMLERYAHLYGNVYALKSSVNKSFARIAIDSVLFRTEFSNIYNHQFTPHLIFINSDSTQIDSLNLFDDGLHGDLLSNDGIYGGFIPPQQNENFYSLGTSTIDNQTNKYFQTSDICKFTTAGPLAVDSVLSVHFPALKRFSIKPYIINFGNLLPITSVTLKIDCNDPGIINFSQGTTVSFPTIPPGATVISNSICSISYDSTFQLDILNLKFEILCNGWPFWKDSLQVTIPPVGIESEVNQTPTEYMLSQNYPNPFNPSTTIKYSIPASEFVTLKVYDVLGNEIATLVNEEKPAGNYGVEFNSHSDEGRILTSGVYFYTLKAGGYTQTKKLILMK